MTPPRFPLHPSSLAAGIAATLLLRATAHPLGAAELAWDRLPPLPDPIGVAGAFAGLTQGNLLVAGGAHFPNRPPWEGGTKVWRDTVHLLTPARTNSAWTSAPPLPSPRAYGVSLTLPDGVLCIGGGDAHAHVTDTFLLRQRTPDAPLESVPRAPLPIPLAFMAGALAGSTALIVGGTEAPGELTASARVFALDTTQPTATWQELPRLPGEPRLLPIAATHHGAFYVFGGCALRRIGESIRRVYLDDAWRWTASSGWTALPRMPRPVAAAPSPTPALDSGHLLILGGDDGSLAGHPPATHPGFQGRLLAYHPQGQRWEDWGTLPDAQVTTPAVPITQPHSWILPSGELRPGVRTPEIRRLTAPPVSPPAVSPQPQPSPTLPD